LPVRPIWIGRATYKKAAQTVRCERGARRVRGLSGVRGPTALSKGQIRGPALSPCLLIFFAGPRGDSEGRCMRMCVRRRWRVGCVRRAVGSSARRAVVVPRVRLAG
jgi:hypothetical protein